MYRCLITSFLFIIPSSKSCGDGGLVAYAAFMGWKRTATNLHTDSRNLIIMSFSSLHWQRLIWVEVPVSEQPCSGRALFTQILGKVLEKVDHTLPVNPKLVSFLWLMAVRLMQEDNQKKQEMLCKEIHTVPLNICSWNVRTLLDSNASTCPERRTPLVAKELDILNTDIAALSKTRLSEEGQLTKVYSGFTLFWIGKPKGEKREGEVGFAIHTSLINQVECPCGINECIMKLRIPLTCDRYMSILSVYAPIIQASEETIMYFYSTLREVLTSIPKEEKLLVLSDFNAHVRESVWDLECAGSLWYWQCQQQWFEFTGTLFWIQPSYL